MLNYNRQSFSQIPGMDGSLGFSLSDGSINIVCGWTSPSNTFSTHFKSLDGGVTFTAVANFPFPSHTLASTQVGDVYYVVGGDIFNFQNDGTHKKTSYKYENGIWTLISLDCGIGNRILGDLLYHNNAYYFFGGQSDLTVGSTFNSILKSTDNCASFQLLNANTIPNFYGGLSLKSFISKYNYMWKFGGGIYSNTLDNRTYDTAIWRSQDGLSWEYFGEMPCVGRHYHNLVSVGNKIYIFAGVNPSHGLNLNDIWSVEYVDNKLVWAAEGIMPFSGRHAVAGFEHQGAIIISGGSLNNNTSSSDVWRISIT